MIDMNLFDDNLESSFTDYYSKFIAQLGLTDAYTRYHGLDTYFEKLYKEGRLEHNDSIDSLVRRCFFTSRDEYDISFGAMQALAYCLENGFEYADLANSCDIALEAIRESHLLYNYADVDYKLLIIAANKLFKAKEDPFSNPLVSKITKSDFRKPQLLGLALFTYLCTIKDLYNIDKDFILDKSNDCIDVYNLACCMTDNESIETAKQYLSGFEHTGYLFEDIVWMKKLGADKLSLPKADELLTTIMHAECTDNKYTVADLMGIYKAYNVEYKMYYVYVKQLYKAGFTLSYMFNEFKEHTVDRFFELAKFLKGFTERSQLERNLLRFPYIENVFTRDGRQLYCLNAEYTLELIRRVYYWDNLDVQLSIDYDIDSYLIESWLKSLPIKVQASSLNSISMYKGIDEIQIIDNASIAFQLPVEFLSNFSNEISKWVVSNSFTMCKTEYRRNAKAGEINVLIVEFAKTEFANRKAAIRSNPLAFSIDFATKRHLIFDNKIKIDQPILMSLLYKHYEESGKDPSVISGYDLQTILALVQVLVLQKSEDYASLFNREDSFIKGFIALRWFVRADDNFYSALLRYTMVLAGIRTTYNNSCICPELQDEVVVNGAPHNILGILTGDKSLLQTLQSNKDIIKPQLKGDVMYFE